MRSEAGGKRGSALQHPAARFADRQAQPGRGDEQVGFEVVELHHFGDGGVVAFGDSA